MDRSGDANLHWLLFLLTPCIPTGRGNVIGLRSKVATAVASALSLTASEEESLRWKSITGYNEAQPACPAGWQPRNGTTLTGIDVLERGKFEPLKRYKKIGLLTNQTGIDSSGRRSIDVLAGVTGS